MFDLTTWLAMGGSVTSRTLGSICFKLGADRPRNEMIRYFVLGNLLGVLYPFCTTFALRGNHPNLVYATMGGLGGIIFVVAIQLTFRQPMSRMQWTGIWIILLGSVMLQVPG